MRISKHKEQQKIFRNVVRACQDLLLTSNQAWKARQYLNSRLDKDNQMQWKFGYFPDDEHLSDLISMVSKADLEVLKLYYPKFLEGGNAPHGHFSDHNLVMPFYNVHGEIVAMLGRCLISEEERQAREISKYNYNNGCRKDLFVYGLDKARDSIIAKNCVILTEGQFDCISLHSNGIFNSVALGWANVSRYQMFQVHRYTNNIIVMLDNDSAGQKGKIIIKNKFKNICNIKTISPPSGYKDIDEFFRGSKDTKQIGHVIDTLNSFGSR
ncbi:toprim domain-containing protein [Candidatus Pacearchaeota archaeon]|jgi:DNA primase|nr:toprim domain-containing protein [Candidatus Pacearchaeota archaeon]